MSDLLDIGSVKAFSRKQLQATIEQLLKALFSAQ
jgi:hypothetical protein